MQAWTSDQMTQLQYVSSTIVSNQILALIVLVTGTLLICAVKLWRKRFPSPFMNPVFWTAVVFAIAEGRFFLDSDMHQNDDNQQAELYNKGTRGGARIVSVNEVSAGRHLNSRYRWADLTCEFADARGRTIRATTLEGYNRFIPGRRTEVRPWSPGQIWAPGATVDVIYMLGQPVNFRLAGEVRVHQVQPASSWDLDFILIISWYVTVAWLGLLLFFLFR